MRIIDYFLDRDTPIGFHENQQPNKSLPAPPRGIRGIGEAAFAHEAGNLVEFPETEELFQLIDRLGAEIDTEPNAQAEIAAGTGIERHFQLLQRRHGRRGLQFWWGRL